MIITSQIKLKRITYYLNCIFLFLAIIDPTRSIFHLTEVVLFLLLTTSFVIDYSNLKFRYIPLLIFCLFSWAISVSLSISGQSFDEDRKMSLLTAHVFLLYTLFQNISYNRSYYMFYQVGKIMSYIVVIIGVSLLFFSVIAEKVVLFFAINNDTILFNPLGRAFLNVPMLSIFYRTSPMVTLLLPFSFVSYLSTRKRKFFVDTILFSTNLIFSGTRANIFACLVILFLVYTYHIKYIKRDSKTFYFICSVSICFILYILMLLINQTNDLSYETKAGHLEASIRLFEKYPIRTILVGFGPGSIFWTDGWGGTFTSTTELSYIDLIRSYGIIGSLGVLGFYFLSFKSFLKNAYLNNFYKFSLSVGFIMYLFIAGTNPFLNCATGYLTLSLYFYMGKNNILNEVK